jgi:ABC-2 type transport system ATP-binding protein
LTETNPHITNASNGNGSSGGAPAIEVHQLTKRYGKFTAVDQLSLTVPAGRIFGFLGQNGAGKSTTIGCMTGLLEPTSGSVMLLGQPFSTHAVDLKRRIGVMPEGLALFDQLRAHEFLSFQARMFGLSEAVTRERVAELLAVFDIANTGTKPLSEFSTGMRKKVAFAAAVIHAPKLLFLDEPFESIDPSTVAMLKDWLRRFAVQGGTVFMTSHVLETVERICDEVAIIHAGKLAWQSTISGRGTGLSSNGKAFRNLEEVFLSIVGRPEKTLDWL